MVRWFSAMTSMCVEFRVFKNTCIISLTFLFVKTLNWLFLTNWSWTMRLISRGRARLVSSEGRQRPALFDTSDLAAVNKMFGSLFLIEEPKPAYIPFCFA